MKKIIKVIAILFIVFFGFCLFILTNQSSGIRAFIVLSASMEPNINTGSIVVTEKIDPAKLKTGDIITFIMPSANREFITHRITNISNNDGLLIFRTKGDKNKSEDQWRLASGGVVGKVVYSIPYLGYVLSYAKTKIAIALFILVPAIYIIFDEVNNIINLFKNRKKENPQIPTAAIFIVSIFSGLLFFSPWPTHALLSNSVTLEQNNFTVYISPTPTIPEPSPTPTVTPIPTVSEPTPTVTPTPTPIRKCSNTIINQSNSSNTSISVNSSSNTGGINASGNSGNTTITSGNSSSNVNITVNGNTNSVNNCTQ